MRSILRIAFFLGLIFLVWKTTAWVFNRVLIFALVAAVFFVLWRFFKGRSEA